MTEKPILFSGEMIRALLDGRKTMTRRVVKPQPVGLYGLTDAGLQVIHTDHESIEQYCTKADPGITQRRLSGREQWSDLLEDQVCRIWSEGFRGLVSVEGASDKDRLPLRISLPQKQESDKINSQARVYGISRNAGQGQPTGQTPGREPRQQQARESPVGDPARELVGPEGAREGLRGRETPDGQAQQQGEGAYPVGRKKRAMQPETCCSDDRAVAVCHFRDLPFFIGQTLYCRETWQLTTGDPAPTLDEELSKTPRVNYYASDNPRYRDKDKWRPSIHMPKKYARIWLKVTDVRVERVQEISLDDCIAEGISCPSQFVMGAEGPTENPAAENWEPDAAFAGSWDGIYKAKGYGWDANPWVWVVTFEPRKAGGEGQ